MNIAFVRKQYNMCFEWSLCMKKYKLTQKEKKEIIESAKILLVNKNESFCADETAPFIRIKEIANDEYCQAYGSPNDALYDLICSTQIADLCFLFSKDSGVKSQCIIECINHENYELAKGLLQKIIITTSYVEDSADWEKCNLFTLSNVISHYPLDDYLQAYSDPVPQKSRLIAIELIESALQYFSEESQEELRTKLMFADASGKYIRLYIEDLMYIVENYARKPRKAGFGSTKAINRATLKISKSFAFLYKLKRIDIIRKALKIIQDAGNDLKPINYNMFISQIKHQFGNELYSKIIIDSINSQSSLSDDIKHPRRSSVSCYTDTMCEIYNIDCERIGSQIKVSFLAKKTFDFNGPRSTEMIGFRVKIKDSSGIIVATGVWRKDGLVMNEVVKDTFTINGIDSLGYIMEFENI